MQLIAKTPWCSQPTCSAMRRCRIVYEISLEYGSANNRIVFPIDKQLDDSAQCINTNATIMVMLETTRLIALALQDGRKRAASARCLYHS